MQRIAQESYLWQCFPEGRNIAGCDGAVVSSLIFPAIFLTLNVCARWLNFSTKWRIHLRDQSHFKVIKSKKKLCRILQFETSNKKGISLHNESMPKCYRILPSNALVQKLFSYFEVTTDHVIYATATRNLCAFDVINANGLLCHEYFTPVLFINVAVYSYEIHIAACIKPINIWCLSQR